MRFRPSCVGRRAERGLRPTASRLWGRITKQTYASPTGDSVRPSPWQKSEAFTMPLNEFCNGRLGKVIWSNGQPLILVVSRGDYGQGATSVAPGAVGRAV